MQERKYRKFCFFDIDGTLAVGRPGIDQYVPASAAEALRKLRENGHFTAIATGRSHAMAYGKMIELGFDNMVSDGGWGLTVGGELRELQALDYQACLDLVEECREKDYIWAIQPYDSDTRFAPDGRFYAATGDSYMKTQAIEGLDPRDYPQIYKMYIACPPGSEYALDALKRLPWCRYHDSYIFVEPTEKEKGIARMVEMLGGRTEDVVVFGDGPNDLSMFTDQWTSVAVGNAVPELKAKASFVTKNADDDGIYHACVHLGLFSDPEYEKRNGVSQL